MEDTVHLKKHLFKMRIESSPYIYSVIKVKNLDTDVLLLHSLTLKLYAKSRTFAFKNFHQTASDLVNSSVRLV